MVKYDKYDKYDVVRGWGWRLLSVNDAIFNDENFKKEINETHNDNAIIGANDKKKAEIVIKFAKIWKKLVPENVEVPTNFYLTGSDTNNSLYDLALQICRKKKHDLNLTSGEILCMDKIWGVDAVKYLEWDF